ncbi:RagB/SusD family nutrient uptake outer membrane protein [Chitinophagaceae bacterium LB-8]|uniref:RagB/SusD family nutrient uptake outer membrane protein n=1 Tax=Paraflavisolibacter caeni TaxID=2982496 RepID=A0A9X3BAD0_9BACT|nr:RagB/SusD family nutrient uptake outer membrane protein [Paraflavisolibacter caeni]MCU7552561.1 RagB/SusD family nutrient uptake outer membrane protein [Paraflavisolibacter caeni]
MKKILLILTIFAGLAFVSCNKTLDEVPKDFYSPENSFVTKGQFESALADIYLRVRNNLYAINDNRDNYYLMGIDADLADGYGGAALGPIFSWNTLNADNGYASRLWSHAYRWIFEANTIIDRADGPQAQWGSEADKNAIVAEAKFLRAFGYHFLANIYGGVPLALHETTTPKLDYVRASQDSVYLQCKSDLEYAVQYMPKINTLAKGGRAPREAAYHLLSEVNICLKDYDGAIAAASAVIDGGNNNLMTTRFGKWTGFKFGGYTHNQPAVAWGDVYFDLFQDGNLNYKEGNREAIWNIEQDPNIIGGDNTDVNVSGGFFVMERWWGGAAWANNDKNNVLNWIKDTLGGRPAAGLVATKYADSTIWNFKGDFNRDIRNSQYNIQREYYWTNPSSVFYGQKMTAANVSDPALFIPRGSPSFKKVVSAVHYHKFTDAPGRGPDYHDNGRTYKDWYIMRLAETYLLRAEAKMDKGDLVGAAADINAIRNRAQATPVVAGDVNIDLILDERARELYQEEFRLSTLMRLGKLHEYIMKYNKYAIQQGWKLDAHINKWPIPNSEIRANTGAKLTQNPGY